MTDDIDTRAILSEITEITEATLAATFGRQPDLEALYRDCPSAFWLTPDAELPLVPVQRHVPVEANVQPPPAAVAGRGAAMFTALLTAGPTFAALALALDGGMPGEPWWRPLSRMAMSLMVLPFTIVFGALLGLVPIVLATLVLSEGGVRHAWLRRPGVWLGAGGALGAAIAALFGADAAIGASLIATSVVCAAVARRAIGWAEPEPATA